ncbi:MAG: endonuclease/exonuclease/phosphatase family protein [Planctomycetota bacterium]
MPARLFRSAALFALLAPMCTAQPIVIDGDTADWNEGETLRCEGGWLKVRLGFPSTVSLHAMTQAVPLTLSLRDDADSLRGPKLELVLSPPRTEERRWGPIIVATAADGTRRELTATEIDLHVAPTAAATAYEIRIGLDELYEAVGIEAAETATLEASAPATNPGRATIDLCGTAADTARAELPQIDAAADRFLAWNVLWSSPLETPDGFARILDATRPDVVLIQEWDRGELAADDVTAWLEEHAAWADGSWSVQKPDAWGVAVATPHPVVAMGPEQTLAPGSDWDFPVRLASAVIDLPMGRTVVGSVHLKCCGSLGSPEDERRLVESVAIRDALIKLRDTHGAEHVVLGGDFNTSGTLAVLDIAAAGADVDGSPLTYADPRVLADAAYYTFGRPGMNNVRTRLDFISYSDASLAETASFVLDTARINGSSLASMGLDALDSAASDHLPVVVDLRPIAQPGPGSSGGDSSAE